MMLLYILVGLFVLWLFFKLLKFSLKILLLLFVIYIICVLIL